MTSQRTMPQFRHSHWSSGILTNLWKPITTFNTSSESLLQCIMGLVKAYYNTSWI
jgi:hypothetical protein